MKRQLTLLLAASCLTAVGQYEVGDVGPAGGWIFYVDAENQFEDWDYLEAWPHTFSFFQLLACDYSPYLSSSELGTGENNTMVFTSNDDTFSAFDFAVLFDGGSRNDWFLPSKSELEALNASSVSALINSGEGYSAASSSVFGGCQWWTYDINNGWGIEDDLYSWEWVLPIRSFHTADDGIVCGQGTIWDEELQGCVSANTADINNDGCVQLNDLLDLLSAYGDCGAEESAWQCGDPLEYQGYDYETVQIGEQCWFAENVRILPEVSPPSVGSEQDEQPHAYVLGYDGNIVGDAMETDSYNYSGVLYNRACIENWQLCPTGWSVPSLSSFEVMIENLGGQDEAGNQLKATFPLWNGTAPSGFNLLAGGYRDVNSFDDDSYFYPHDAFVLTNETFGGVAHYLHVNDWSSNAYLMNDNRHFGFSVRCIKDSN